LPYLNSLDRCQVTADDEQVIRVDTLGADSFQGFLNGVGHDHLEEEYDVEDGTPVEGEFEAMVWPDFAIAGTSCEPEERVNISSFTIGIEAEHPEDDEESVRALSELIQPFMKAAIEQSICTPGDNPNSDYPSGS
jgi:hypothetical protein